MADISKLKGLNGTVYDIKDTVARQMATGGIILVGETTTAIVDLASTPTSLSIVGKDDPYTVKANDAVFYGSEEFVWDGTKWHKFGDRTGLGALALKDSASGPYTPAGTVSQPTFTGETLESTGKFTPQGSVSAPNVTVTPETATIFKASSATSGGAVTPGVAAQATMPVLTMTVQDEVMEFSWTPGAFTPNTPTSVTLPTFAEQQVATGIASATASQPTFTGSEGDVEVSGTPAGTVSQPTFSGTPDTVSVS